MNEVVNEVTRYSKLGHPRSTVKNTSPWEIAAPGFELHCCQYRAVLEQYFVVQSSTGVVLCSTE